MIREIEWLSIIDMSSLIKFKSLIEENKRSREINSRLDPAEKYLYGLNEYVFNLSYTLGGFIGISCPNVQLIKLDEDDINYFYNKYVVGNLDRELEETINKIKKQYGK